MNWLLPSPTSHHRVRPRAVLAVLVMGLLLATACGGSNGPQATGATSKTSSTVSGNAESEPRESEEPSAAATPVSAELAHDCVPPGGTQTITITSEPRVAVSYQTVYSDGTKGSGERTFTNPDGEEGYGGGNGGLSDESGRWTDTWRISPKAPEGSVEVQLFALGHEPEMGTALMHFEMAGSLGSCE